RDRDRKIFSGEKSASQCRGAIAADRYIGRGERAAQLTNTNPAVAADGDVSENRLPCAFDAGTIAVVSANCRVLHDEHRNAMPRSVVAIFTPDAASRVTADGGVDHGQRAGDR